MGDRPRGPVTIRTSSRLDALRRELATAEVTSDPTAGTGTIRDEVPALPDGHHHAARVMTLGNRADLLDRATQALCTYEMHRRAGFRVAADHPEAQPGDVVVAGAPAWLPVHVAVPCRITEVVRDGPRRGLVLATLPGHPVLGEERFEVRRDATGVVRVAITAYSRPASPAMAALAPALRVGQGLVTRAFLAALRRAVR